MRWNILAFNAAPRETEAPIRASIVVGISLDGDMWMRARTWIPPLERERAKPAFPSEAAAKHVLPSPTPPNACERENKRAEGALRGCLRQCYIGQESIGTLMGKSVGGEEEEGKGAEQEKLGPH